MGLAEGFRAYRSYGRYALKPLLFRRYDCCLGAIFDVHLLHDVVDVGFDGFQADREALGDGAVGQAVDEQVQHFAFAFGEDGGGLSERETRFERGAFARLAVDLQHAPRLAHALFHVRQAQVQLAARALLPAASRLFGRKASPVVADLDHAEARRLANANADLAGGGVFADVVQRLLHEAIDRRS